ncbi:MAG: PP2C family protein-serine/threonine phosphatase [Chloroflexota bacterium]
MFAVNESTKTLKRVFESLSEDDINELNNVAVRREYPSETVICEEGKMEHTFYVIESGTVAVTQRINDENERMVGVMRGGEFFGESALLEASPRAATVRTMTECWLIEISKEVFELILRRNPSVALTLLKGITDNLRSTDQLMIAELELKNQELAQALSDLKDAQAELLQQERINSELEIASNVQESILPTEFPASDGLEFGYFARSAREVGGDFYDVYQLDEHNYGVVVADVSGKSWSAAFFMAIVRALLSREVRASLSPSKTMHQLHHHVMEVSTADMFVTIFYAIIDQRTKHMRYVRAGHDRPILYRDQDKSLELLNVQGRFVGLWPELIVDEAEMSLQSGDTLVCYSDGVPDAENEQGETFGLERLMAVIQEKGHQAADDLANEIAATVDAFRGNADASDDITILVTKAK